MGSPKTDTPVLTSRNTEFTINNEIVDVTNKGSTGWREVIDAGIKSMSVSCDGVYEDEAYEATLNGFAVNGGINAFVFTNEDGDEWQGNFLMSSYARSGTYNGEEAYSFTLESAGVIAYVAGA